MRTTFSVVDAQFTGAGATRLLSGVTTANGTIGGGALVLDGATLEGSHTLAGGLRWVSGTIGRLFVAGTTTIPAGATLTLDNPNAVGLDGRSLVNAGTIVLQQAGGINMPGSTITNQPGATFDVQTDADLAVPQGLGLPAATFDNAGIFRKSGGTGATEVPPSRASRSLSTIPGWSMRKPARWRSTQQQPAPASSPRAQVQTLTCAGRLPSVTERSSTAAARRGFSPGEPLQTG